jgi:ferredoxin--NADP+ reductase
VIFLGPLLTMNTQKWLQATVVSQTRWTERLHSLRIDAEPLGFEAGQFTKLGLEIDGEIVGRPYSFVSAPGEQPYEFYYSLVPEGPLSPRLVCLEAGSSILLGASPSGFLVLSEIPDSPCLWLLSTGTGIGPFLSMLSTDAPWKRFGRVVLVHAARHAADLSYREREDELDRTRGEQFRMIRVVSRERDERLLHGRIPGLIEDGQLEAAAGANLEVSTSQVMICGNPSMVTETTAVLLARGMRKHRRRSPGQITVENYW